MYQESPPTARPFMELSKREWMNLIRGTAAVIALLWVIGVPLSGWPTAGLFLTTMVLGHMCMTAARHVAFPDLIAFACCLQWVVAPWLATMFIPRIPVFRMSLSADDYLSYAVPATAALWLDLHLPSARHPAQSWSTAHVEPLDRRLRWGLDATIAIGLVIVTYAESIPPSLGFLGYLIASFRFFAALAWMVTGTPGWKLRVGIVMIHLAGVMSTAGVFYLVIHWGGYFLLVYAFIKGWRWRLAGVFVVGLLGIALLQEVKPAFRAALVELNLTGSGQALSTLGSMMYERAAVGNFLSARTEFGDLLVRFNQGWIIARIMTEVPRAEPFARGETIVDAAIHSIIPRPLFPFKREGASREIFERFTGITLSRTTRMGLSIIGEFYANFSIVGGVIGTFVYGYLLGALFGWFRRRASPNPVWWAAAAIVLLPGIEPGFNLEDIANHVVKAAVLLFLMRKMVPVVRGLLAATPQQAESLG
jgi:hypothetical protein